MTNTTQITRSFTYLAAFALASLAHAADYTIAAAISLRPALEKAQPLLDKAAGGHVAVNYGASGQLASQIKEGAPIDLFLSADQATAQKLADAKLVTDLAPIAANQLVLIVPADSKHTPATMDDLAKPEYVIIAIGEPKTVPAGNYAKECLTHFKLYDTLARRLVTSENVAQTLAYVARGEADVGFVYATDALNSSKVHIALTLPADSHDPILYYCAAVANSPHAAQTPAVIAALKDESFQKILASFGFTAPPAAHE